MYKSIIAGLQSGDPKEWERVHNEAMMLGILIVESDRVGRVFAYDVIELPDGNLEIVVKATKKQEREAA